MRIDLTYIITGIIFIGIGLNLLRTKLNNYTKHYKGFSIENKINFSTKSYFHVKGVYYI